MKSINKAVEQIVLRSDIPFFAMQDGVLNLSAYAKLIRKEVENECKKPIKTTNAIVMSLSRIQNKINKKRVILPKISVRGITIKRNLSELSIVKTPEASKFIQKLLASKTADPEILLLTYGLNAINVIIQNVEKKKIKELFKKYSPSAIVPDLVSMTLSITEEDVMTPNIFYTLLSKFAAKEINIIEIATAKLEITLVLEEKLLPQAYEALEDIISEKEKLF